MYRVFFVIACLGWGLLAVAYAIRPISWQIALALLWFHLMSWYFSMAMREGFYALQRWNRSSATEKAAWIADYGSRGIILFCQIIYLLSVFHLLKAP